MDFKGGEFKGHEVHHPGGARGLHRLRLCVAVCPAKDKANPKHKAIDMAPQRPLREAEAKNYEFFLGLPEVDRGEGEARRQGHRSSSSRSSSTPGACAGCGETPYVKLLTQLFGDRAADRQRHRLLVDLRRQPADDAVHAEPRRPRAGLVELALRGQRRVRLRLPPRGRQERRSRRRSCCAPLAPQIGEGLVDGLLGADQATEAGIAAQRDRVAALRQKLAGVDGARGALARDDRRLPREEERLDRRRRRLGLRHRLRRPRPRDRAGAQRQHPGARHRGLLEHRRPGSRRPPRSARRPSSRWPARRARRRTWA